MKAFTFDFKSLYDNLKPELVKEAGIPDGVINVLPGFGDVGAKLA